MSRRNLIFRWQDGLLSSANSIFAKSRDFCAKATLGIFLAFVSNPLGNSSESVREFDASPKLAQFS